jgi:hypothetical protein
MPSDAVKLARIQERQVIQRDLVSLLQHPVYSVLVAFIVIELLQSTKVNGQPLMGSISGTALETALITKEAITALSTSGVLKELLPGAAKLLGAG